MNIKRMLTILILILLFISIDCFGQFKKLSGIHDTIDSSIKSKLHDAGFGKVTHYFDDLNKIEGIWELYPSLQISKNITAVSVSTIPGVESKYSFLILFNPKLNSITDTLGPYYDSAVDAIAAKIVNDQLTKLKVRLINPPEAEDPKYTIIEY